MHSKEIDEHLEKYLDTCINNELKIWLNEKIEKILSEKSSKSFYLTYSLLATKIDKTTIVSISEDGDLDAYLKVQKITCLELARLALLRTVLKAEKATFAPHVSKIIQLADTAEMATFLKYLILLPNPEQFKLVAVDALRTNVATVFDALALHNPYPARYFEDKQWNQMFLKAAFMQRPLHLIVDVEERGNAELARIISDYAHERWAAGRDIDPYFWRPVAPFLNETLLKDMKRLLESTVSKEQQAGALCCYNSSDEKANQLLQKYPNLQKEVENNTFNWNTIHN